VLSGELGTGKTCFARGFVRGAGGDPGAVRSPSFTLQNRYVGERTVLHFDVYFTPDFEDLVRSDLHAELDGGAVALIEWGERFAARLPADRLEVTLGHVAPEVRTIRLAAGGSRAAAWLERALKAHGGPGRERA
jgi:tRNA threonylcarbamoyladenosine biosynthesis protein TsaE